MALSPPSTVGAQIQAAVAALGITAGSPVTAEQLTAMWTAIYQVIYTELTTKAEVQPGSFNCGGTPVSGSGGPLE